MKKTNGNMKFLFVGSEKNLDLDRIGGIESVMRELISFLVRQGNKVEILLINDDKKDKKVFITENGDVPIFIMKKSEARKYILGNFDVINFLQSPFENPFFALRFFLMKKMKNTLAVKLYFTFPTVNNIDIQQKMKLKFLIDKTLVFSKRMENKLKKITKDVTFLYPPVSEYYIKNKRNNRKKEKIEILFAGRLSRDKGLEIVIDVFKELPDSEFSKNIIGYFADKSDEEKYLPRLQNINPDKLEIEEHKNENRERAFLPLNQYDILLLPYQELGPTLDTPLLILEGLASGCIIVTSGIEPVSSIEGNIIFVKNFTESSQFIDAIKRIKNPESTRVASDFSSETFGEKYLKFLGLE